MILLSFLFGKFRHHRRMVRGAFQLARFFVHVAGGAAFGHGRAGEHQVDAQAEVAAEAGGAVVPPAEEFFLLIEQAEGVSHIQLVNSLRGPVLGAKKLQGLVFPCGHRYLVCLHAIDSNPALCCRLRLPVVARPKMTKVGFALNFLGVVLVALFVIVMLPQVMGVGMRSPSEAFLIA